MAKAYCYGAEITEIIDYIDDVVIFRIKGQHYNTIALTCDIEVRG